MNYYLPSSGGPGVMMSWYPTAWGPVARGRWRGGSSDLLQNGIFKTKFDVGVVSQNFYI